MALVAHIWKRNKNVSRSGENVYQLTSWIYFGRLTNLQSFLLQVQRVHQSIGWMKPNGATNGALELTQATFLPVRRNWVKFPDADLKGRCRTWNATEAPAAIENQSKSMGQSRKSSDFRFPDRKCGTSSLSSRMCQCRLWELTSMTRRWGLVSVSAPDRASASNEAADVGRSSTPKAYIPFLAP